MQRRLSPPIPSFLHANLTSKGYSEHASSVRLSSTSRETTCVSTQTGSSVLLRACYNDCQSKLWDDGLSPSAGTEGHEWVVVRTQRDVLQKCGCRVQCLLCGPVGRDCAIVASITMVMEMMYSGCAASFRMPFCDRSRAPSEPNTFRTTQCGLWNGSPAIRSRSAHLLHSELLDSQTMLVVLVLNEATASALFIRSTALIHPSSSPFPSFCPPSRPVLSLPLINRRPIRSLFTPRSRRSLLPSFRSTINPHPP